MDKARPSRLVLPERSSGKLARPSDFICKARPVWPTTGQGSARSLHGVCPMTDSYKLRPVGFQVGALCKKHHVHLLEGGVQMVELGFVEVELVFEFRPHDA
jgi:hypothetical protein